LAAKPHVAIRRQPPFDVIGVGWHSRKAGVERGLRDAHAERPTRLDESKDGEDLIIAEDRRERRHGRGGIGRLCSKAAIFGLVEEVFVGVLPGMSGLVMRRRTPSGEFVVKLPERLALQVSAMTRRTIVRIDALAESRQRDVRGIGKMRIRRVGMARGARNAMIGTATKAAAMPINEDLIGSDAAIRRPLDVPADCR
jgi:hypothetical protein